MAPRGQTLRVKGYREFLRAAAQAPKDTRKEVRAAFREVGEIVRADAAQRMEDLSPKTAAGFRTSVRQKGVAVQQRLGKTTGKRPDWGGIQMNDALLPALDAKEDEVVKAMDDALDRVADHFER